VSPQVPSWKIRGRNVVIAFTREPPDQFLSPGSSRKRLGQKGVGAIFSSAEDQTHIAFLIGVLGIVAGIIFWTAVILDAEYARLFGTSVAGSYLSLFMASLGLILVICGAGICKVSLTSTPVSEGKSMDTPDIRSRVSVQSEQESPLKGHPGLADASSGILSTPNAKFGLVAFIESSAIAALYSGLVEEYQSNLSMQQWVRLVLPAGRYFLSWETVLVLSTLLGLITIQFLPGRILAE
jgi:hypothetical protein